MRPATYRRRVRDVSPTLAGRVLPTLSAPRLAPGSMDREEVMSRIMRSAMLAVGLVFPAVSTEANVITDWDAIAVSVTPPSATGLREMAIMHVAMFDAVNSIGRRYRPYLVQLTAS